MRALVWLAVFDSNLTFSADRSKHLFVTDRQGADKWKFPEQGLTRMNVRSKMPRMRSNVCTATSRYGEPDRCRPRHRARLRERVARLVLVVITLVVLLSALSDRASGVSPRPPSAATRSVHVVRPGDTLWSIASTASPGVDPRPLVGAMAAANGGSVVKVGQRVIVCRTSTCK